MPTEQSTLTPDAAEALLDDLTEPQREAVAHDAGPLLIIAGAGTGKTTVITRRIARLIGSKRAAPNEILALTFSEKAATEMQERVDVLLPYGYLDVAIRTFHAFGDQLLRENALRVGLSPYFRVLSKAEQVVFLRQRLFALPLARYRPLNDPGKHLDALTTVFSRAKDELVDEAEFRRHAQSLKDRAGPADDAERGEAEQAQELAECYARYRSLMREGDSADFGDQVFLAVRLLEEHPEVAEAVRKRYKYILVDEFQDTNYAQFRLLQLLAPRAANVTVVADDDQSIYKWRGAAISNVLKFLDHYESVRTVVLIDNFRSTQQILDCAYRLIRFNDPDRLEVRQGINKRLVSRTGASGDEPHVQMFDTASSEADWVGKTIRRMVASGERRPGDIAILVRSNREADLFLRALNVAGIAWHFSGTSGLFAREESKMLLSCLKVLADPEDSLSWYHVASSRLYRCPMRDLTAVLAYARRINGSFRRALEDAAVAAHDSGVAGEGTAQAQPANASPAPPVASEEGKRCFQQMLADVGKLIEASRTLSAGQLLYRWMSDRGLLADLAKEESTEHMAALQTIGRFFEQLRKVEDLIGPKLVEVLEHLELFTAVGNESIEEADPWGDRVHVLTIHKSKGLEFPVVFMVGLVQGRFPGAQRTDPIELPEALIKDILPVGDYHLQEERRLFYVGMTRAKDELYMTAAHHYGGKSVRKVSRFVLEAMNLSGPAPAVSVAQAKELIERSAVPEPLVVPPAEPVPGPLKLDPHGADDYLTCPLKYRFSHVIRVPIMRHHVVIYGAALHRAVEEHFKRQLAGQPMTEEELIQAFERHWSAEGFLTKEHEQLRLAQGRETLRRFYVRQKRSPEKPHLIEERFRFQLGDDILVAGRWDRVDVRGGQVTIVDYKTSDIREQEQADRRAKESSQLMIYALAWQRIFGAMPEAVELHFLDTELIGRHEVTEKDLSRAEEILRSAARGIRAGNFRATPQEFVCRWCAYQPVCPAAIPST